MRGDDLEPVVGGDPRGEFLGERHVAADHRLERFDAVAAQREPQLERPEPPSERDLPVAVVDHGARFRGCAERRYSGRMLSAPSSAARSAVQNRSQSKLTPIHLCGFVQ